MGAHAERFRPTKADALRETSEAAEDTAELTAEETVESRIKRVLAEEGDEKIYYIHCRCLIATIFAAELSEDAAIQVACPEDELRRAKMPAGLRPKKGNFISLYPLSSTGYSTFAQRMIEAGNEAGEYDRYSYQQGEWQLEEYH